MTRVSLVEHVLLLQLFNRDEVRPLEVLDVRMIGRKAAGRALEAVAVQRKALPKPLVVARPAPAVGPLDDRLPNLAKGLGLRSPEPPAST